MKFGMRVFGSRPAKAEKEKANTDDKRPVKFVRERENVWRVVWADSA